ncbi:hypothetical protein JW921_08940, partial [Candidatus Fermentibacterales bacterium]|nr:hypothetical protein [Candidatus Fermentibacterales bacterium]
ARSFLPLLCLVSVACALPALGMQLRGEALDSDYLAHLMWARHARDAGITGVVSRTGVVEDPSIFYPNTVPKPLGLLFVLAVDSTSLPAAHAAAQLLILLLMILVSGTLVARQTSSPGPAIFACALLGLHPAVLVLSHSGSPVIMMLLFLLTGSLVRGRASMVFGALAALTRPEGLLYSTELCLRRRRALALTVLIPVSLAAWLGLNRLMAGDWLWSAREVRYVIEAMPYPRPSVLAYPAVVALRSLRVLGPVLLFALISSFRSYPWSWSSVANLLLLWVSLALGSLVLDRYVDLAMILAIPWAVASVFRLTTRLRRSLRAAVLGAAFLFPMLLWIPGIPAWDFEVELARRLDRLEMPPDGGLIAVNELLVPRIALANDITDPVGRFVALDRAVFERRDLGELGVSEVLVAVHPVYLPGLTRSFLEEQAGSIEPDTLLVWSGR